MIQVADVDNVGPESITKCCEALVHFGVTIAVTTSGDVD
jgi:hypothetical protein